MTIILIAIIIMLLWIIVQKLPSMVELSREQKRFEQQYKDRCAEFDSRCDEFDELEKCYVRGHYMLIAQLEKYGLEVKESMGGRDYIVPIGSYGVADMPIPPEGDRMGKREVQEWNGEWRSY